MAIVEHQQADTLRRCWGGSGIFSDAIRAEQKYALLEGEFNGY